MKSSRFPGKVTHEITSKKVVTKIFDQNNRIMETLTNKREPGGFGRKTMPIEDKFPEFMSLVDGFNLTDTSDQLRDFKNGVHEDQDEDDEA